jgi:catechol 2,3-dioxygenase-like lactoylglutathione lyase family enzyme
VSFRVDQIDHVELFVPDRHEAAAWYQRVLGLNIVAEYEHWAADPRGPLMISSDGGHTKLALFQGTPQGSRETAGFHLVAFRVGAVNFVKPLLPQVHRRESDIYDNIRLLVEAAGRLVPPLDNVPNQYVNPKWV